MILGYLLIIQETDLCYYPIPLVVDQTGAYVRVWTTVSSGIWVIMPPSGLRPTAKFYETGVDDFGILTHYSGN